MNYKAIRATSFLSGLLSVFLFALWVWLQSVTDGPGIEAGTSIALRTSSTAFLLVAILAVNVASVLEQQADEIAALKRDLAEQRPSGARS